MQSSFSSNGRRAEVQKRGGLLQAIHRAAGASRLNLSKTLGISNSRVCDLVDTMLAQGLLVEDAAAGERRGRRGVEVRLNPAAGHWVGLDMEAKRLRMVVTDFAGTMVWNSTQPLDAIRDGDDFLRRVLGFIDQELPALRECYPRLLGIGLAASGVTDLRRGVIRHYDMLPGVTNVPLRDRVAGHTALPCVMQNNIRAMTLAEWTSGAARGLSSFVCVAVRSGVGAGVVLDNRLYEGVHGLAGEIGYMVVPGDGRAHGGGAGDGDGGGGGGGGKANAGGADVRGWRHLHQVVSESALAVDLAQRPAGLERAVARRVGHLIGAYLGSIAALIDPQAIVLAGDLLAPQGPVWPFVEEAFRATALAEIADNMTLAPAVLGPFAAAIGAAYGGLYEITV